MTAPLTDDLEAGSDTLSIPSTTDSAPDPTKSLSSILDDAIDNEPGYHEGQTAPADGDQDKARADRGDGRNTRGEFVGKPGEQSAASKTPASSDVPRGTSQAPPETPAAEPAVKTPFRYRALGKTNDVPDSEIGAEGEVIFRPAAHGRLRDAFNALEVLNDQVRPLLDKRDAEITRLTQVAKSAEGNVSARDAQAEKLVEFFSAIAAETDDEKALGMMWRLRQEFPLLVANAERDHYRSLSEAKAAPATAQPPATEATAPSGTPMPTVQDARAYATEHVEQVKVDPAWRGISAGAWKHAQDRIARNPFEFYRPATAEDAQQYGVPEGLMSFDLDLLWAAVDGETTREAAARETAAKQTTLAKQNATRTQASVNAPPVTSGTQAPPKGGPLKFKSKADYEAWKNSDDIDED